MTSGSGSSGSSSVPKTKDDGAAPATVQREDDQGRIVITEGSASIVFDTRHDVFYNNVQVFNRDLTTAVIDTWRKEYNEERMATKKGIRSWRALEAARRGVPVTELASDAPLPGVRILEGLSATGLRAVRFAKEIDGVAEVVANDFDAKAVDAIRRNVEYNGLPVDGGVVRANHGDAVDVMMAARKPELQYDCIDLDPYGTASPFIDSAVQAVADGGLLCVTCTDAPVLTGSHGHATFAKYGCHAIRAPYCHEQAVRILVNTINVAAARQKRVIEPLLCLSVDFYVRVFVRVRTSAAEAQWIASKVGSVYQCVNCDAFHVQRMAKLNEAKGGKVKITADTGPPCDSKCAECGSTHRVGGPMWMDKLHDSDFISKLLKTADGRATPLATLPRIRAMCGLARDELSDVPFFYNFGNLFNSLRLPATATTPLRSAILNAGYRLSMTHCKPGCFKTDAPIDFIYDVLRTSAKEKGQELSKKHSENTVAARLHKREIKHTNISFTKVAAAAKRKELSFPVNPEKNWGPRARAGTKRAAERGEEGTNVIPGDADKDAPTDAPKDADADAPKADGAAPSSPKRARTDAEN